MKIKLELRKHCIETEAKNNYERLLRKYIQKIKLNNDQSYLEEEIEGLKYFLEHADFGYLRSTYPVLSGKQNTSVIINIPGKHKDMKIIHDEKIINFRGDYGQ
jgi:hypothetical protein